MSPSAGVRLCTLGYKWGGVNLSAAVWWRWTINGRRRSGFSLTCTVLLVAGPLTVLQPQAEAARVGFSASTEAPRIIEGYRGLIHEALSKTAFFVLRCSSFFVTFIFCVFIFTLCFTLFFLISSTLVELSVLYRTTFTGTSVLVPWSMKTFVRRRSEGI